MSPVKFPPDLMDGEITKGDKKSRLGQKTNSDAVTGSEFTEFTGQTKESPLAQ